MQIILKNRELDQIEYGIIYGVIALLTLSAGKFLPLQKIFPSCAFKGIIGIPCPTCGSTRSIISFSAGDIAGSIVMNPLAALTLIVALLLLVYSLVALMFSLPKLSASFTEKEKDIMRASAVLLVLANWLYLYWSAV